MKQNPICLFVEFKKRLKDIFNNPFFSITIIICLALNIFLWFFILLVYQNLKEVVIIHYSVLIGVDWLENKRYLFLFPFSGLVIFIFNFVLTTIFYQKKQRLISFYLVLTSFLVNLFLTIGFFLVYTL